MLQSLYVLFWIVETSFLHVIKYYVFPFVGSKLSSYKK